ncbi:PTS transporter subunit IIC [Aerococcaceae bacterium WGS1372]
MDTLINIVQTITSMGASAILPIIITLLGLVFRMKLGNAIKSGLMVGVGFIGLSLVVQLLESTLEPAITYYSELGSGFTILDIGWPAVGGASWTVPFAGLAIPIGLMVNILLVRLKVTKTLNVDIWNYMHFLVPGALAYYLFDSFWIGLTLTILLSILALFVGDIIAPSWQEQYGLDGTTCSTIIHTGWTYPVAWIINKIIDFIPGLNKLDFGFEEVNKRLGIFGEPIVIGVIVGALLGIITNQEITTIVPMGMGVAGVMVLMPRVVGVLMDGLTPIGSSAKSFMTKQMGDDADLNIGMDVALGLGDPMTITVTVISIPLIMIGALILPSIQMFPIGLLMSVTYISVMTVMASKGNFLRSILSTVIFGIIVMYVGGYVAPGATEMLKGAGVTIEGLGTDFVLTGPWEVLTYWISTLVGGM